MAALIVRIRQQCVIHGRIRRVGELVSIAPGQFDRVTMSAVIAQTDPAKQAAEIEAVQEKIKDKSKPVTLKVIAKGNGTVTVEPEQDEYKPYTVIVLTAVGEKDFEFVEWSGDWKGNDNPIKFEIVQPMTITATFEKPKDPKGPKPKVKNAKAKQG